MDDKEKIELLARHVKFALSFLDCKGDGIIYNLEKGEPKGHWTRVFAQSLRDCGYNIDDDAVDYAKTPYSKRKGKSWKALCEKLKLKGYSV